jgi:hypothetical protein
MWIGKMIADGKEVAGFFFLNFPRKLLGLDCIMIKKTGEIVENFMLFKL